MLTRLSVHCAERIVAASNSNGFEKSSAHFAPGYALRNRLMIFFTRDRTLSTVSFTTLLLFLNPLRTAFYPGMRSPSTGSSRASPSSPAPLIPFPEPPKKLQGTSPTSRHSLHLVLPIPVI